MWKQYWSHYSDDARVVIRVPTGAAYGVKANNRY